MKTKFSIGFAVLILASLVAFASAASVLTFLVYDDTNGTNLQVLDGDNVGFTVTASSLLEDSMTLTVELKDSSGNTLEALLDAFTTNDSYSNHLVVTPAIYGSVGSYTIVSTVTAASGQTDTTSLDLEVLPQTSENNPPVITSVPPVNEINENIFFSYQVLATDADGDSLIYTLTQAPAWITMTPQGLVSGTSPEVDADYQFTITVEVSDSQDFDRQTFYLTVKDVPGEEEDTTPPVITVASPSPNQVFPSTNVLFDVSTNEDVSQIWYTLNGANNVYMTLSGARDAANVIPLAEGSYNVIFYAQDLAGNVGQSTEVSFSVDVSEPINHAPVVTSTPVTSVDENEDYEYQVVATDEDGDDLTYFLTQGPNWLSISSTGLLTGTADPVSADTDFEITISISDSINTITQVYTLTVGDVPDDNDNDTSKRAKSGGGGLRVIPAYGYESQQYFNQFEPIRGVAEDSQQQIEDKNTDALKVLLVIMGLLILAILILVILFLLFRA